MGVGSSKKALPKDQVEDDMHEDEYEVEKIVAHRGKGKTFEYRIRWQGYDEDEDTWEPPGNINNAGLKVHEYWANQLAQQETVAAKSSKATPKAAAAPKAVGGVKKKASSTPKRGTPNGAAPKEFCAAAPS